MWAAAAGAARAQEPAPLPAAVEAGTVILTTNPVMRVEIDGRFVGNTPLARLRLLPGQYNVVLTTLDGTHRQSFPITLAAGQTLRISRSVGTSFSTSAQISLHIGTGVPRPRPHPQIRPSPQTPSGRGVIFITSNRPATVYVGGRAAGRAPGRVIVQPGRHRITLVTPDGRRRKLIVRIQAGQVERRHVVF